MLAIVTCFLTNSASPQAETDEEWAWVNKHFPEILDTLLPLETRAYVEYRSHRDYYTGTLEYSFVLGPERKHGLDARVRIADSVSIHSQMSQLHRENPDATIQDLKNKIKVKEWNLNEQNCPAVRKQFQKLKKLRFTTPDFDVVVIHPLIHEFNIGAAAGDLNIVFNDGKNALVKWALETRDMLEACTSSSK